MPENTFAYCMTVEVSRWELRCMLLLGFSPVPPLRKLFPCLPGYSLLYWHLLWTSVARILQVCCFSVQPVPRVLVNWPHLSFWGWSISLEYGWDSHLISSSGRLPYRPHFSYSPLFPAASSTAFCVLHRVLTGLLGKLHARGEVKVPCLMW